MNPIPIVPHPIHPVPAPEMPVGNATTFLFILAAVLAIMLAARGRR